MTNITSISGYPSLTSPSGNALLAIVDTSTKGALTTKKVSVANFRQGNIFYLDAYGADPTGQSSSDSAWTKCYTAASASLLTHSGAMIVLSAGTYLFSVNTVVVSDGRIGFLGAGRLATTILTTGNTGTLLTFNSDSGGAAHSAAPVGGFTAFGWSGGNSLNGIQYGDRANGLLTDVVATGFNGTSSRGFWFHDNTDLSEGSYVVANADQNTINYDFDKVSAGGVGSFDYSQFYLHMVCTTVGGSNATGIRFSSGQHCFGGVIHLCGNISATTGLTSTCVVVGSSGSDTSYVQNCQLNIAVEADTSAGTVKDIVVNGASGGIITCSGQWVFSNASGSYSIGSVSGSAVVTGWGHFVGPLFSGHGTLTSLGPSATAGLATYTG